MVVVGEEACRAKDQFEITCQLPASSAFQAFGEFLVVLEEQGTGLLLSDDHSMLVLLVLPLPEIQTVAPEEAIVASHTGLDTETGKAEHHLL